MEQKTLQVVPGTESAPGTPHLDPFAPEPQTAKESYEGEVL